MTKWAARFGPKFEVPPKIQTFKPVGVPARLSLEKCPENLLEFFLKCE